ncbi:MAG: tRNA 2-thiouridine(34) synthase MnmA [Mycoplasmataceae bacterium]|nr:tRNA 2-thiouridine(34) synthase MnmA [Mycoplasmataceae bacterium]
MVKGKKIILGMSGGVDSSVCAYLLKKQGYDVIGLFMQNWDTYTNGDFLGHTNNEDKQCNVQKDFQDAQLVAKHLGIPIYRVNFIKKYWQDVFQYTINEYKKGDTPNPDILCNKYIKFGEFIKYCQKTFQTDQIAMGHYATTKIINNKKYLTLAKDDNKDQTYFLCWLTQYQLDCVTFPIGNLAKDEVRQIAKKIKLPVWDKKDSTGICFIGERKFKDFLKNYIKPKSGKIIDIQSREVVGTHEGVMFYTIGQNKNLNLSGQQLKYYVCKKDVKNNILYVVTKKYQTKFLTSTGCVLKEFNWINGNDIKISKQILIRFRHRQPLIKGTLTILPDGKITLKYPKTLAVACGQFAVIYQGKKCLGGGIICDFLS